jgi:hypothetical protein
LCAPFRIAEHRKSFIDPRCMEMRELGIAVAAVGMIDADQPEIGFTDRPDVGAGMNLQNRVIGGQARFPPGWLGPLF